MREEVAPTPLVRPNVAVVAETSGVKTKTALLTGRKLGENGRENGGENGGGKGGGKGGRAGGGLNGASIYHSAAAERNEVWGVEMLGVVGLEVVFAGLF